MATAQPVSRVERVALRSDVQVVRATGLSFATELYSEMKSVQRRWGTTQSEYGDLIKAMKELAVVEEAYGKGLRRVASCLRVNREDEFVGVSDTLGAVVSNLHHSAEMHVGLAASITSEVVGPLTVAKSEAHGCGKALVARCASAAKQIKVVDERYRKALGRKTQLSLDAEAAVEAAKGLGTSKEELSARATEIKSKPPPPLFSPSESWTGRLTTALGRQMASSKEATDASKSIEHWFLPNETERREQIVTQAASVMAATSRAVIDLKNAREELIAESRSCAQEGQRILCEFQQLEETAIVEMRDSLRKLCVFESSALSNRHYDLQTLARVLDDLHADTELMRFIDASVPHDRLKVSTIGGSEPCVVVDAIAIFPSSSLTVFGNPDKSAEPSEDRLTPLAVQPARPEDRSKLTPAPAIFELLDQAALLAATTAGCTQPDADEPDTQSSNKSSGSDPRADDSAQTTTVDEISAEAYENIEEGKVAEPVGKDGPTK